MSFLQHLQQRKAALKHTETTVTCADGTRYLEKHCGSANAGEIVPLAAAAVGFVVDTAPDAVPALVVPHLYVGSQDCCVPEVLHGHCIASVLSVGIEAPHRLPGVEYTHVECLDLPGTQLANVVRTCNAIIRRAVLGNANILVHCNAGVSRSVAVVIAYLMTEHRLTFDEAYTLVRAVRPCAQPNAGFVAQLRSL